MKKIILTILCSYLVNAYAQNVGIGTTAPTERLQVTQTGDVNKNVILSTAYQTSGTVDYQNTAITGFGQGNGLTGTAAYGMGIGVKGIGSSTSFGGVGVYAGIGPVIPIMTSTNRFFALYADAGLPTATNKYAGVFIGGNVGIGTTVPVERLHVVGNVLASGEVEAFAHNFSTPKTYYYSICGSDVSVKNNGTTIEKENFAGGGVYILGGSGSLTAPVHLPHGATVTRLTVYALDVSGGVDVQVALRRNTSTAQMAVATSSGAPGETSAFDNTITNAVIDNSLYAYTLDIASVGSFWPDASLIVRRVVIEYTLSSL